MARKFILLVFALALTLNVANGLSDAEQKECLKLSKRTLRSMMKAFNVCNDKLQLHKISGEEYQKKVGCVVKCVMQVVKVLDDSDVMTEATLRSALEAQIPKEYVTFAYDSLSKCIKDNPLDPKDENCKSYMTMGTCMQGAAAEMCGVTPTF